jgi:hypothetical protein
MLLSFALCLLFAILIFVVFLQSINATIAKNLVARLLIDDIYYHETRSKLLFNSIDRISSAERLSDKPVQLISSESIRRDAWLVAQMTDKKTPVRRKYRPTNVKKCLSLIEAQSTFMDSETKLVHALN